LAFGVVSGGVWVLRYTMPDTPRPFRTPWVPVVPILAIVSCGGLMWTLKSDTWWRLALWLLAGAAVYAAYGYKHSKLRAK